MAEDPNGWQRAGRIAGPTRAETVVHSEVGLGQEVPCPNCAHSLMQHSVDLGCHVGWENCSHPIDGCNCPLSLAIQHDPPREGDIK